jgi:hypothetical protein
MNRFALVLLVLAGCSSKKSNDQGLPPAQEWGANQGTPQPPPGAANPHAGGDQNLPPPNVVDENGQDPHAGLRGAPPAGIVDENGHDPHAGLAPGASPHGAGGPAGMDTSTMGALAPDPNRPIDPAHHIRGLIKVGPKAVANAKSGGAIFLIVKQADATGQPTGTPLAVDKLTWNGKDLPFEMTEGQAMIKGTQLVGDVVVTARYDQDGDAISKQPGDITGQLRVKIPADNVSVVLDTVLP